MRILLLCAATFAAGLMAGTLVWTEPGPPQRGTTTRPSAPTAAPDSAPGRTPLLRGEFEEQFPGTAGSTARSRNADVRELAGEAASEIERLTTSERAEDILDGQGVISGTVRDSSGNPVSAVIVTALPEAQPFDLSVASRRQRETPHVDRDLSEVAGAAIQGELWRRYARRTATTGPDGRFEIEGLMDARHSLTAYHRDYDVKPASKQGRVVPDAVVEFVARPVAAVRIEVRMPDDTLAENAWLSWQGANGNGWAPWTPDPGTVRMPLGTCRVKAQVWVPEAMQSIETDHTVVSGTAAEPLVLKLEGRRMLTARLALPEGFVTPTKVEYRIRLLTSREDEDPELLIKEPSPFKERSRAPGRATWIDLEPGRYLVGAYFGRRRLLAHGVAEVGDGPAELELAVEEPEGPYLTVKLIGPDGGPVPGAASFRIISKSNQAPDVLQREDGIWLLFLSNLKFKAGESANLRVGTKDYGSTLEPIETSGSGTHTIRFEKPSVLSVDVDRYGGSGLEGKLYVALRGGRGVSAWAQVTGSGSAELSGVQPGDYSLLLYLREGKSNWPLQQQSIGLRRGEESHTLSVPALHSLRVRVEGRLRTRAVSLECKDPAIGRFRRSGRLKDRVVTFEKLAAGSYEIRHDKKRVPVRVPGPAEVVVK